MSTCLEEVLVGHLTDHEVDEYNSCSWWSFRSKGNVSHKLQFFPPQSLDLGTTILKKRRNKRNGFGRLNPILIPLNKIVFLDVGSADGIVWVGINAISELRPLSLQLQAD